MADTTDKPLTPKQEAQQDRERARKTLKDMLPEESKVFGFVTQVSSSGMSARVKVLAIQTYALNDKRIVDIAGLVSRATGMKWNDDGTIAVKGCGFDRVQHVVDRLSQDLYGHVQALKYERI